MLNKLGKMNWLHQASPVGAKPTGSIGASQNFRQEGKAQSSGGDDLVARLNALDNRELKPKTGSSFDVMA